MTIRNFSDHLTKQQLRKGEEYFKRKKVRSLSVDDDGEWTAKVQGRDLYDVVISTDTEHIERVSCECIAHTENEYCKHVVAVLFAIQQKEGLLITDDELMAMLKKMSVDQLRRFIAAQATKDPSLQSSLCDWIDEEASAENANEENEAVDLSKAVKSLYLKMCDAVEIKDFAKAKALAEQGMQKAKEKGDQKDYVDIQRCILAALQPSSDILGVRELARRFYKESRNMLFYHILKATYVSFEWQRVVTAHIERLEKNIPAYAAGTANPAELADVYYEEYEDGDALLNLFQQVPRLSFLNEYADCLGRDYDNKVLPVYREALLGFARQHKTGDDTTDFLTGIQQMAKLRGGQPAKELANEIRSINMALFKLIPGNLKNS